MKRSLHNNYLFPLLILLISIIPLIGLVSSGLPVTHDGQDHVARIANFYANLVEGTLVPRWAGNLNWGYGHPILMFLYPFPSYMASLFHFTGFSLIDSVKLVFGVGFVLSGLGMYLWLKEQWNQAAGFVGALLYLFAPYRFVDLYVRGAIGEHTAFIFPPFLFYCLYKLYKHGTYSYLFGASAAFALLILSHNAISLMFVPLLGLYSLYLLWQSKHKKRFFIQVALLCFFGFGLSAFFWFPAFAEGKYTLRDIVTSEDYASRFVPVTDFFYGAWSYGGTDFLSKQIGIMQWIVVISSLVVIYLHRKSKRSVYFGIGLLSIFLMSLFIMTSASSVFWTHVSLLKKFQFPWRFLTISVFATAVMGAYVVSTLPKKRLPIVIGVFVFLLLFINRDYWYAQRYMQKDETFFTGIYNSTTDTGESAPIWSVRFMEKRPPASIEVIDGDAVIQELSRTNTNHVYRVEVETKSRIKENTLYFPGWKVTANGKEVPVEFQDPSHRGLLTFFLEPGVYDLRIQFTETKLRVLANSVSAASLFLLVILGILMRKRLWPRYR